MNDLAKLRAQVYADERDKQYFDRFHERARTRDPDGAYELTRLVTSLYAYGLLRTRAIAPDNVPGRGPVILAPNHASFMDHFLAGCYLRRKIRFMAKSQLFKPPAQFIYSHGGVFPVRRGSADEDAFVTAEHILNKGGLVAMYCEGGRSRSGRIADQAKRGIGRLALRTGAPIVPIAIHGSQKIRNWKRLQFPKITVQYGEAFRFAALESPTRDQQQDVADQILDEIKKLYSGLEETGRKKALAAARQQRRAARAGSRSARSAAA
jgi:1-acyl-sn-glycerol-3-phosphate acyltransferase